jgi:uncharacterized protein
VGVTGSPFVVTVTELVKHPGTQRLVVVSGPLADLALTTTRVPAGGDVAFDGVLESTADHSVTATGVVSAPWVGECRRCLREVDGRVDTDVQEVFAARPIDGETYPLDHERLDLEPMVRDAVLLALPLAPLCDGGCEGPDPEGHPVAVEDEASEGEDHLADPRWGPLSELRFD